MSLGACSQATSLAEPSSLAIETPTGFATTIQTPTVLLIATPTFTPISIPTLIGLDHSIIDIPIATPTYDEQCGGMYPIEMYSLSWTIDDAIKTLDPKAEGWAEAIIQDCTDNDGKTRGTAFGMWFYIDKPTSDLKDYESLGSWIINVMNLLDTIPRDQFTPNAEPTTVNFRFYISSGFLDISVPIHEYWAQAGGKSGEEVFNLFYTKP